MPTSSHPRSLAFALLASLTLAACTTSQPDRAAIVRAPQLPAPPPPVPDLSLTSFRPVTQTPEMMYAASTDSGFPIRSVDTAAMNPEHVRQVVDYATAEVPGTVVVDQTARRLYFVMPDGKAVRYAVGVGPIARAFPGGVAEIARKAAWPRWIPTQSMIERSPGQYKRYAGGVDGGPGNPMGARALYMHQNGVDTYYRVHGTTDPSSIGRAVSAGCIRLLNQDVIDLYERVQPGAKIVVF